MLSVRVQMLFSYIILVSYENAVYNVCLSAIAETQPLIIQKYDTAKSNYILTVESSDVNLFETFAEDSSFRSDVK